MVHVWHKTPASQPLLLMAVGSVSGGAARKDLTHEVPAPWRSSGRQAGSCWSVVRGQVLAAQGTDAEVINVPHGRGLLFQELLLSWRCPECVQRAAKYGSRSGPSPAVRQACFSLEKKPRRADLVWLGRRHGLAAVASLGSDWPSDVNLRSPVICMRMGRQGGGWPMRPRQPRTLPLSLALLSRGRLASLGHGEQRAEECKGALRELKPAPGVARSH